MYTLKYDPAVLKLIKSCFIWRDCHAPANRFIEIDKNIRLFWTIGRRKAWTAHIFVFLFFLVCLFFFSSIKTEMHLSFYVRYYYSYYRDNQWLAFSSEKPKNNSLRIYNKSLANLGTESLTKEKNARTPWQIDRQREQMYTCANTN